MYSNKNKTINSLIKRIAELQDLKDYIYSKHKQKVIDNKVKELQKELLLINR